MYDHTGVVYVKKMLNFRDLSYQVRSMTKTRQDKYMSNLTGAAYVENETEFSWSIIPSVIYNEN